MAGETLITVIGNLTGDPELRYTQNGKAVANLTIASTPRTFDRQANDWKDGDPLFMRGTVWEEFAEHVAGSLYKGTRVIAVGFLKQRSYETKEGEKRTSMELEIQSIGPDLKYATAQVAKATRGDGGRGQQGGQQQGGGEPWAQPQQGQPQGQPQQQAQEPWATQQPGTPPGYQPSANAGADVWNTPGNYTDETPF